MLCQYMEGRLPISTAAVSTMCHRLELALDGGQAGAWYALNPKQYMRDVY